MKDRRKRLSPAEVDLMQSLWSLGSATVSELQTAINAEREEPVSRNTVQVQLQRLEQKGWVSHSAEGRVFRYEPTVSQDEGTKELTKDFRNKVFGGSSLALVRCLVDSDALSEEEMAELKQLIQDKEEEA